MTAKKALLVLNSELIDDLNHELNKAWLCGNAQRIEECARRLSAALVRQQELQEVPDVG